MITVQIAEKAHRAECAQMAQHRQARDIAARIIQEFSGKVYNVRLPKAVRAEWPGYVSEKPDYSGAARVRLEMGDNGAVRIPGGYPFSLDVFTDEAGRIDAPRTLEALQARDLSDPAPINPAAYIAALQAVEAAQEAVRGFAGVWKLVSYAPTREDYSYIRELEQWKG